MGVKSEKRRRVYNPLRGVLSVRSSVHVGVKWGGEGGGGSGGSGRETIQLVVLTT